jgi:sigma-E factor negative regulatory protein RseA
MTSNAHEQLSALLDGELPAAEIPLAVRRVGRDRELRQAAERYSLIGDALRGDLPAGRRADLVKRVRKAIDAAPAPAAASTANRNRVLRFGTGFAVAASVALVALVALPGGQQQQPEPPALSATEVASPVPEQRMMIQPVFTRPAGGGPDRLTRYYVNHSEYAPAVNNRGALTRIIVIRPESAATASVEPDNEASGRPEEERGNAR